MTDITPEQARMMVESGLKVYANYGLEIIDGETGEVKAREDFRNLMTNEGLNQVLDVLFGSASADSLSVGLKDGTAPAAGDTMTEAAAYEVTSYDEANRQSLSTGSASSQSIDNSGSPAQFTLSGSVTIGGAFVTTDNTKSGTSGTLYSSGDFTGGDRSGADGDIVKVTVTFTAADA